CPMVPPFLIRTTTRRGPASGAVTCPRFRGPRNDKARVPRTTVCRTHGEAHHFHRSNRTGRPSARSLPDHVTVLVHWSPVNESSAGTAAVTRNRYAAGAGRIRRSAW